MLFIRSISLTLLLVAALSGQTRIPGPGGAQPSGTVTPDMISGQQLWWAADTGNNCGGACTNGANQSTWLDKSSNANNGSNGTFGSVLCSVGVYNTSQINGKPAVSFPHAPTCFTFSSAINLQTASTVFTVLKLASTSGPQVILSGASSSLMTLYSYMSAEQLGYNGTVLGAGTAAPSTSWHQVNQTYNGTTVTWRIDRTADGSATPSTAITGNDTGIGFDAPCGCNVFSGQVAELIIYNRVLNSTEIGQVETYLNGRYGL